ncbi:di-heme cytochrome c (Class I) [Piscinibacter sakaiensis]|uniref:Di-heme cytochrome c (Class I) n=1 Tax=Piscinibacter sakaiensis TaxID=1547922 RepID=A0A0K8P0W0_PISS1|nr:di-heme cytochrome c (Class I) [Piscinibacter sakaiensis]
MLAGAGTAVVFGGLYDVSAVHQHLPLTYDLLKTAMRQAVRLRARGTEVPALDDPVLQARGLAHFRRHCVACHGAPGEAPEPFARGLTPLPSNLVDVARRRPPAELFWVAKHGLKMTGMPAWNARLADEDLWATVAFIVQLPRLSPADYRALTPLEHAPAAQAAGAPDPERGRIALRQQMCITCHAIPGVVGPDAPVGPSLHGIGGRAMIAGRLPNTPAGMVRWLREPQRVKPGSAMPDLGLSERDARDMAAYLQTLR